MSADRIALERACRALWSATLALMTAYMRHTAPAHRLLLARRIAVNFETLARQHSFSQDSRLAFSRLHRRWHGIATALARPATSAEGAGPLQRLRPFGPRQV
jgi:hypothetical protein